jgi:aspartyl-tRNA(Asn)/glutamyl-tRNA(Gln) amidotransferase subunit A
MAPASDRFERVNLTQPFSLVGVPAISLPCGLDAAGLPIGVQLTANVLEEPLLLRAARALEAALAFDARPPLVAAA